MRKILALIAISMAALAGACGPQEAGPHPPGPAVRGAATGDACSGITAPDGGTLVCPPGCKLVGNHCEIDRAIIQPQPPG